MDINKEKLKLEIAKINADLTRPLINLHNIQQQAIDAATDIKEAAKRLKKMAG